MGVEKNFLLGALLGAVVGVTATLIINPTEGKITRKKINSSLNKTAKEIKRKAPKLSSDANDTTKNVVKKAAAKGGRKLTRTKLTSDSKKKSEVKKDATAET